MLRSLMTGVTGIRAHQTMLDVVGNNVANVNTTGYKKSSTVFQDLLYQSSRGATGPGNNRGGINPLQVGLGVSVAGVETVNTGGPLQFTNNRTDVAIQGDGFYVFSDGMNKVFSRAGNFSQDGNGILVHVGTGFRVQGYEMVQDPANPTRYIQDASLGEIRLLIGDKMEAKETSLVGFKCNLDSRVNTYLPFGVTNLESTMALKVDPAHPNLKPGQMPYLDFIIKNKGTPGNAVDRFITYEITQPNGVTQNVVFEITDIKDGKPVIELVGGPTPVVGAEDTGIIYDSDQGILKIVNTVTNREMWRANVLSSANYTSFKLENKSVSPSLEYDVLLEFDRTDTSRDTMGATLWIKDGATIMNPPVKLDIPLNPDGTFNIPNVGLDLTHPGIRKSGVFPGIWEDNERIIIKPAAEGYGIQISAINDPAKLDEINLISTTIQNMISVQNTKAKIYDCMGNEYTLEVAFKKVGDNTWRWEAFFPGETDLIPEPRNGTLQFGPCGKLISPESVVLSIPYSVKGSKDAKVTLDFSGKSFGFDDSIEGITQYGSTFTTKPYYQDGYTMGVMNDFAVSRDGTINGIYTNGKTIPLYRLALATFANPNGLERIGNTCFRESANSGMAQIGVPMEGGAGEIYGSNLEMSNVDISEEFTRLILAQRGFQANARIVTVSDGMLEELVNLKR